jgi:hypothetical protein
MVKGLFGRLDAYLTFFVALVDITQTKVFDLPKESSSVPKLPFRSRSEAGAPRKDRIRHKKEAFPHNRRRVWRSSRGTNIIL